MLTVVVLMCVLTLLTVAVIWYVFQSLDSRIDELLSLIDADTDISSQEQGHYEEHVSTQSDFDARIAKFQDELNTPTYADNDAVSYHPGVVNIPHSTVTDVPLKYEPEYAE